MKKGKINKAKLQMICTGICFTLSVLLFIGTSFAYFSDTKQVTNTMTVGNVAIELTEAAVKREAGNLVEDPSAPRIKGGVDATVRDYGVIYPGISIFKDPTIKNVGGSDAWVAAKITITDGEGEIYKVMGYDGFPGIDMQLLLSGGMLEETAYFGEWNGIPRVTYNDKFAIVQSSDVGQGQYCFYVFFHKAFAPGDSEVLFDTFSVPEDWTNEEMQELSQLTIHIQAYAVQIFDLENCYEAMTTAFATHFTI